MSSPDSMTATDNYLGVLSYGRYFPKVAPQYFNHEKADLQLLSAGSSNGCRAHCYVVRDLHAFTNLRVGICQGGILFLDINIDPAACFMARLRQVQLPRRQGENHWPQGLECLASSART